MRKLIAALITSGLMLALLSPSSQASLGSVEDYSNPRIVPMYNDANSDYVAYSAFLYSPRILFTVAHGEYYFDNEGKRIDRSPADTYAGLPNSLAAKNAPRVKVIKRIISKTYRFDRGMLGDFAVFVLEKDLANVEPAALMTKEIEAELIANKAQVQLHGYGAFSDTCQPGQTLPCQTNIQERSKVPRLLNAKLYSLAEIEALNGFSRPQLKGSLTYYTAGKLSICSGDSGGSNTILYKGKLLYLSVIGNGMNTYGCGAGGNDYGAGGILYSTPIYEQLDIIKEAEEFVAEQLKLEAAAKPTPSPTPTVNPEPSTAPTVIAKPKSSPNKRSTITCVKGKTVKKVTAVNPKCPAGFKKK